MTIQEIYEQMKNKEKEIAEIQPIIDEAKNYLGILRECKSQEELEKCNKDYEEYKKRAAPYREKQDKLVKELGSLRKKWFEIATILLSKLENK